MKLVTAIVKPFKLDEVKEALNALGIPGITVTEVRGLRPPTRPHRGVPGRRVHASSSCPRCGIEVLVDDADADRVADAIVEHARTGHDRRRQGLDRPGRDGRPVRTGEMGSDAL